MNHHSENDRQSDNAQLVYAHRGSRLVHVSEVARGLDCGCLCPYCRTKLVARQGAIRVAHFAHQSGEPCSWGRETAIHLLAKEIISRHSALELPAITSLYYDRVLLAARKVSYSNVRIEQRFHDIIPDIIVATVEGDLLIEVFVTNKVRAAKAEKIRAQKARAIEVDVRHLRHILDRATVETAIIDETEHKQWLYALEFEAETPPIPRQVFLPGPPTLSTSESENTNSGAAKPAETLDYEPVPRYIVPQRLTPDQRAKMMGQVPAQCGYCGTMTTNWASIECDSGKCVCRGCVSKRTGFPLA